MQEQAIQADVYSLRSYTSNTINSCGCDRLKSHKKAANKYVLQFEELTCEQQDRAVTNKFKKSFGSSF
eukprot:6482116-Amphidinium_carterae.1